MVRMSSENVSWKTKLKRKIYSLYFIVLFINVFFYVPVPMRD